MKRQARRGDLTFVETSSHKGFRFTQDIRKWTCPSCDCNILHSMFSLPVYEPTGSKDARL